MFNLNQQSINLLNFVTVIGKSSIIDPTIYTLLVDKQKIVASTNSNLNNEFLDEKNIMEMPYNKKEKNDFEDLYGPVLETFDPSVHVDGLNTIIKSFTGSYPNSSNSLLIPGAGGYDVHNGSCSRVGRSGGGGGTNSNRINELVDLLLEICAW